MSMVGKMLRRNSAKNVGRVLTALKDTSHRNSTSAAVSRPSDEGNLGNGGPAGGKTPLDDQYDTRKLRPFSEVPGPKGLPIIGNILQYMPPSKMARVHEIKVSKNNNYGELSDSGHYMMISNGAFLSGIEVGTCVFVTHKSRDKSETYVPLIQIIFLSGLFHLNIHGGGGGGGGVERGIVHVASANKNKKGSIGNMFYLVWLKIYTASNCHVVTKHLFIKGVILVLLASSVL